MNRFSALLIALATGLFALGCTEQDQMRRQKEDVREAQQNVQETKDEAAQDVREAQQEGKENIDAAREDLQEEKKDVREEAADDPPTTTP